MILEKLLKIILELIKNKILSHLILIIRNLGTTENGPFC